jgi:hypothetical protein
MRSFAPLFLLAALTLSVAPASATVLQTVRTDADPSIPSFSFETDSDSVSAPTPDGIDRNILARVADPGGLYDLSASAGTFGQVGLAGRMIAAGKYSSTVSILDNAILNPLSAPQRASANFIVDGGAMALIAGKGSSLAFDLLIESATSSGGIRTVFDSRVRLEVDSSGATNVSTSGDSLGVTWSPGDWRVEIPLSFQSVDLGIIAPNDSIGLRYEATMMADIVGFAEIAEFGFSDPLTGMLAPTSIRFEAATLEPTGPSSSVPEPVGAPLLGFALAAGALARRRRG